MKRNSGANAAMKPEEMRKIKNKYLQKLYMTGLCILHLFAVSPALTGCGHDDTALQEIVEDAITEESESEAEDLTDQSEQEKEETAAISAEDDNVDDEVVESDTFDYSPYVGKTWVDDSWNWGKNSYDQTSFYISNIENGILTGKMSIGVGYPTYADNKSGKYFGDGNLTGEVRNGKGLCTFASDYYEGTIEITFLEADKIETSVHYERLELVGVDDKERMDGTFVFKPYNIAEEIAKGGDYEWGEIVEEDAFQVHTDYWEDAYLVPVIFNIAEGSRKGQQYSCAYLIDGDGDIYLLVFVTWATQGFKEIYEEDVNGDGYLDIKIITWWYPFDSDDSLGEVVIRQLSNGTYQLYEP